MLNAALASAAAGNGRIVVVHGEPGIGKTRLLEEFAREARAAGAHVRWGRCYEREGAPAFWPWLQVLRSEVQSRPRADLRALLGDAAPDVAYLLPDVRDVLPQLETAPALDTPEGRFRLFESVVAVLRRVARTAPLVILLDDLQAADHSSLLLLEFLAQSADAARIIVVAAYRDGGLDSTHPLQATLRDLVRRPVVERIALAGLDRDAVTRLVAGTVAAPVSDQLVDALHGVTAGNPLFLGEIVLGLAAPGERTASLEISHSIIPAGVHEAIACHVAVLSPRSSEILRAAAVLGTQFSLATLEAIASEPHAALLSALDEAIAAHVVAQDHAVAGRYGFAHALIRDALYNALAPAERRRLHRAAADLLACRADEDEHLAEIAHHFIASAPSSGDGAQASIYARRAADRALAMLAFEEAERLYLLALETVGEGSAGDASARVALMIALGTAQTRAAKLDDAKRTFLQAAASARALGSRELLSRAILGYGGDLAFPEAGARDTQHIALLEEAIASWGDEDATLHTRLLVQLAAALYFTDDASRRVALCDHAVAMARRLGDDATLAEVLLGTHAATSAADNARERLGVANALLRLANRTGDRTVAFRARAARMADLLELGDMAAADADLEACDDLARDLRQPSFTGLVTVFRAMRATLKGRFEEGETLAAMILTTGRWVGRAAEAIFAIQFMMLRYLQGRMGELVDPLRVFAAVNPAIQGGRCGFALACLSGGLESEARNEVSQVMAHGLTDVPRNGAFLPMMGQLAEICAILGDADRVQIAYDTLLPYAGLCVMVPNGTAFIGAVDHYLGLLAQSLGREDAAVEHFEHALAVHAGMGAQPWLALTQCEYGALLVDRGGTEHVEQGDRLIAQAVASADALGMKGLAERARACREAGASRPLHRSARPLPAGAPRRGNPAARAETVHDDSVFRSEGDYWTIAYAGQAIRLRDSRGIRYLAHLVWHPAREFHATELVHLASGGGAPPGRGGGGIESLAPGLGDAGEAIDEQARREYHRHLESLREALEEAEAHNERDRAARLRTELDAVADALGSAPRGRRVASHAERARLTVTKGVKTALGKIQKLHPALGRHLAATVRRGYVCIYTPDPRSPINWSR